MRCTKCGERFLPGEVPEMWCDRPFCVECALRIDSNVHLCQFCGQLMNAGDSETVIVADYGAWMVHTDCAIELEQRGRLIDYDTWYRYEGAGYGPDEVIG